MMNFKLERVNNSAAVAMINGAVDIMSAPTLQQQLQQALHQGCKAIFLNLKGVTLMDHSGITTLRTCLRMFRESGGELALVDVSHPVDMKLRLLRLDGVFPIYTDIHKAMLRI